MIWRRLKRWWRGNQIAQVRVLKLDNGLNLVEWDPRVIGIDEVRAMIVEVLEGKKPEEMSPENEALMRRLIVEEEKRQP